MPKKKEFGNAQKEVMCLFIGCGLIAGVLKVSKAEG